MISPRFWNRTLSSDEFYGGAMYEQPRASRLGRKIVVDSQDIRPPP